jgi:hypothetical protein
MHKPFPRLFASENNFWGIAARFGESALPLGVGFMTGFTSTTAAGARRYIRYASCVTQFA